MPCAASTLGTATTAPKNQVEIRIFPPLQFVMIIGHPKQSQGSGAERTSYGRIQPSRSISHGGRHHRPPYGGDEVGPYRDGTVRQRRDRCAEGGFDRLQEHDR